MKCGTRIEMSFSLVRQNMACHTLNPPQRVAHGCVSSRRAVSSGLLSRRGYAFVSYRYEADAADALKDLEGVAPASLPHDAANVCGIQSTHSTGCQASGFQRQFPFDFFVRFAIRCALIFMLSFAHMWAGRDMDGNQLVAEYAREKDESELCRHCGKSGHRHVIFACWL